MKGSFRRSRQVTRDSKVVSEGIRRPDRKYAENSRGISQYLGDVVDRAVAATCEDRVATRRDGSLGLLGSVFSGFCRDEFSFDSAAGQHVERGMQIFLALLAPARVRIVEQGGLTHTSSKLDCT